MNPLPPNADELVSAYLDGEAAPQEIVIVESSPELMSRVDALRAISQDLGSPVPAPSAQKEAHIGAALDAFDALFAASDPTSDSPTEQPPTLAAVPTTETHEAATVPTPASDTTVTSFEAARQRRRPRRFNTGVIAAAVAVVVLFVAAAALSFGRGSSDDVATASLDAPESAEVQASADGDEAMADDAAERATDDAGTNALSELDAAAEPAPALQATPAPEPLQAPEDEPAAGASSDAMAEEESDEPMEDAEENFADDEAADDDAGEDPADEEAADAEFYFLGEFDDREALKAGLELNDLETSIEELLDAAANRDTDIDLDPNCLDQVSELANSDSTQLLAEALLEDEGFVVTEIYVVSTEDQTRDVYVVDSQDCTIISVLEDR